MILGRMLTELGYQVFQAANGEEALTVADEAGEQLSLVLVDWNMPEMNGLEFIKRFRIKSRYWSVPVVMVTTEREIEQMVLALDAGANEYVMKPFTKEVIVDKLRLVGAIA
jgi:two-component system chemotaxis response regulator CheY